MGQMPLAVNGPAAYPPYAERQSGRAAERQSGRAAIVVSPYQRIKGSLTGSLSLSCLLPLPTSLSPLPLGEGYGEGSQGSPKVNDVMGGRRFE